MRREKVESQELRNILGSYAPISLAEMERVKLMNRIDTKYILPRSILPSILQDAQDAYFVQEIDDNYIASYDTLYYDTPDLEMYMLHHDRHLVRQKIRVRRYVESDLTFLEIKRKTNKGRTKKKRVRVDGFALHHDMQGYGKTEMPVGAFIDQYSNYHLVHLSPHLRTLFQRITLVNKTQKERLTIDINLRWENQITGNKAEYPDLVILELKSDGHIRTKMAEILLAHHIHPFKISKYCVGTVLTTPHIKHNRFKTKIRRIEKMTIKTN